MNPIQRSAWSRSRSLSFALSLATALRLAACASPTELVVEPDEVERSVHARAPEPELVAATLELADLARIDLRPPSAEELADPASDGFWHGAAYAFHPRVRAARRELLAARGRAEVAGAPEAVGVAAKSNDLGDGARLSQLEASFDLVGLLRLGPAGAEREVARALELSAAARLEAALWSARFEVDRARARLAAARALVLELDRASASAAPDRARIELLLARGWLAGAELDRARVQLAGLDAARSAARAAEADARAALVEASGLPPDHPAFDAVAPALLGTLAQVESAPPPEPDQPLAATHPVLRARLVACAEAEARVRRAAAAAWPGIALGPRLLFPDGGTSFGGLLQLRLPFPGSWRGELAAAEEARARALEAYEEALLSQLAQLDAAQVRRAEARARLAGPTSEALEAARQGWTAAAAGLRVQRAPLEQWNMALGDLVVALRRSVMDRELAARAALDQAEARGPRAATVDADGEPAATSGEEVRS